MPREEKWLLVNEVKELGVKFGDKIVGTLIRGFLGHNLKGPHVATPFLEGHFYEVLSHSVTVGELFVFTAAAAIAFIVNEFLSRTVVTESWGSNTKLD